ncbi:hypothetical protein KEM56_002393 [Ascosphaera pollenicola]|nr:hypothetical protein KEM56_002393 [Ascosphaera pollenicola]
MDSYEGSGTPRYRDDDMYSSYRRRPSPSPDRRRPSVRARSRSPFPTIDRYQPDDRERERGRDRDYREYSRDPRPPRRDRERERERDPRERDTFATHRDRDRDDYYTRERELHDADRYRERDRGLDRGLHDRVDRPHDRERNDRRRAAGPMSPLAGTIDRYVPGQSPPHPLICANTLPNPLSLDYQVGFNWFAEWWRTEQAIKEEKERAKCGGRRPGGLKGEREAREDREKERVKIQEAYDKYKSELQVKMAKTFVQQHRGEEWFKEKYLKEMREPIRKRLMEYRRGNGLKQWNEDLENGVFDEFTLEGIYKSESDGAGGVIEKEEGEAPAVGETLGVLDLVPAKGGDLRDDAALHAPALLIKTLAPNVSREKIEEFCRECLGEEKGGFEWLSLSDPNSAKRFHRMGWIMLKLDPEAGQESSETHGIDRPDPRDELEEGEEGWKETKQKPKKPAAVCTAEHALPLVNEKSIRDPLRGDFTAHVGVHYPPPNPRKKALWDLFSAPARIERDLELAKRVARKFDEEMGDGVDSVRMIEEKVDALSREGRLVPPVTSGESKPAKKASSDESNDSTAEKLFEEQADTTPLGDDEEREEGEGEGDGDGDGEDEGEIGDDEDSESPTLLAQKKELDLLVEYLRRVYNFCLFCVFEADSVHELVRKCPGGHLRRPRSGLSKLALEAAKASARGEPFPLDASKGGKTGSEDVEEGEDVEEKEDRKKGNNNRRTNRKFANKSEYQLNRAFNWVRTFEDKLSMCVIS